MIKLNKNSQFNQLPMISQRKCCSVSYAKDAQSIKNQLESAGIFVEQSGPTELLVVYGPSAWTFEFATQGDWKLVKVTGPDLYQSQIVVLMNQTQYKTLDEFYPRLAEVVPNVHSYCIGCGTKLQVKSNVFATCGNIVCSYKLEELMLDNDVTDFIKANFEVFKLLCATTNLTVNSPQVLDLLDPFPNYFLKSEYKTELLKKKRGTLIKLQLSQVDWAEYCKAKDIPAIAKILESINPASLLNGITNFYPTDQMLSDTLGKPTYQLLRFIIKSCCVNMENQWSSQSVQIWKITHPFYVENQFADKATGGANPNPNSYLFHGSNSACWYSILRNGIKVLSKTSLQKNGAAYGPGIYVSDNYNFALSYSLKSAGTNTQTNCIVGVYEVQGDKAQYLKAPNIYVVPTHESCLLKYLIVGKPAQSHVQPRTKFTLISPDDQVYDETKWIQDYFSTTLSKSKSADSAKMIVISNKKLAKEFARMSETAYQVTLVNSNILDWEVTWSGVTLAFKFPQLYPFEPAFVFVKSPRFSLEATNITSSGAICCEYLTKSNWLPAISIENLIVQIFCLIIEPNLPNVIAGAHEYAYTDAVKSYEKIAKGNGWL